MDAEDALERVRSRVKTWDRKVTPLELLGQAGNGIVFLGRVERTTETRVFKVEISPNLTRIAKTVPGRSYEKLEKLEREALLAADAGNAGAGPRTEFWAQENTLVMEPLKGKTVEDFLKVDYGGLSERAKAAWLESFIPRFAQLVTRLHRKGGIIHNDIKPANLFQTEDGRLLFIDFGLAQYRHNLAWRRNLQRHVGQGTPLFAGPGILNGTPGAADDWYSFFRTIAEFVETPPGAQFTRMLISSSGFLPVKYPKSFGLWEPISPFFREHPHLRVALRLFANPSDDPEGFVDLCLGYDELIPLAMLADQDPSLYETAFLGKYREVVGRRPPHEQVHIYYGDPLTSDGDFLGKIPRWSRTFRSAINVLVENYRQTEQLLSAPNAVPLFALSRLDTDYGALARDVGFSNEVYAWKSWMFRGVTAMGLILAPVVWHQHISGQSHPSRPAVVSVTAHEAMAKQFQTMPGGFNAVSESDELCLVGSAYQSSSPAEGRGFILNTYDTYSAYERRAVRRESQVRLQSACYGEKDVFTDWAREEGIRGVRANYRTRSFDVTREILPGGSIRFEDRMTTPGFRRVREYILKKGGDGKYYLRIEENIRREGFAEQREVTYAVTERMAP